MEKWKRPATTAERLKEAMQDTGKRQADLVRETGIDKGSISHYISGKYEPKSKAINKLAVALDVSEAWLWGYDVPRGRTQEQKKNDDLVKAIAKLRSDAELFDLVSLLMELPPEQRPAVKTVLAALCNK